MTPWTSRFIRDVVRSADLLDYVGADERMAASIEFLLSYMDPLGGFGWVGLADCWCSLSEADLTASAFSVLHQRRLKFLVDVVLQLQENSRQELVLLQLLSRAFLDEKLVRLEPQGVRNLLKCLRARVLPADLDQNGS